MPKYKVPAEPEYNTHEGESKRKKSRQPTTSIPMKSDWLSKLKTDMKVSVEVSGTIVGINSSSDEHGEDHSIRIAVDSIEYYGKNEKEVDDVMNGGEED